MSPWTSYVVPIRPQRVAQKRKVSKIWTISLSCDNSETVRDIGCQLVLITNRKSYTGFRWYRPMVTLNHLERRIIALILRFSPNSIALLAEYVTMVEWPIMSANIVSQFPSSTLAITNPPCSAISLQLLSYLYSFMLEAELYNKHVRIPQMCTKTRHFKVK